MKRLLIALAVAALLIALALPALAGQSRPYDPTISQQSALSVKLSK